MAVGTYAGESMIYRTVGMMDAALSAVEKGTPGERAFEEAFRAWGQ